MLHDKVVVVGICAQISDLCTAPVKDLCSHSGSIASRRQSVNRSIRLVVSPRSVINPKIGGVFSDDKGKAGIQLSVRFQDIAYAARNILSQLFLLWIAVPPLVGVPVLRHIYSCSLKDRKHLW